jgi:ABC-type bacteriocin/lantibiotic exporter with double-glycine peptidase domain
MQLLNVPHRQQRADADCLAACAAMVLEYLAVPIRYDRLLRLLRVEAAGASFFNLSALESLGLSILVAEGTMDTLPYLLDLALPIVVSVDTAELSYWQQSARHALVIVGLDDQLVYANDPAFGKAPQAIPDHSFESAWLQRDYLYAVISLTEVQLNWTQSR